MKKMNKHLILIGIISCIGLLYQPGSIFAGGHAGNGGFVYVCRNDAGEITSIELTDFREGRRRDFNYDLEAPDLSVNEKIEIALRRLSKLDPERAQRYREDIASFEANTSFVSEEELLDDNIRPAQHATKPVGCTPELLVKRNIVKFPEDKKYLVNNDLWTHPLFNNDNEAGIKLHEAISVEAFDIWNHSDSTSARYFNSVLTSRVLESYGFKEYLALLRVFHFPKLNYFGKYIHADESTVFYETGEIRIAKLAHVQIHNILDRNRRIKGKIEFYKNGTVIGVNLVNSDTCRSIVRNHWSNNDEKTDRKCFTHWNDNLFVSVYGTLFVADYLSLDENGMPVRGNGLLVENQFEIRIDPDASRKVTLFQMVAGGGIYFRIFKNTEMNQKVVQQLFELISAVDSLLDPEEKHPLASKGLSIGIDHRNELEYDEDYQAIPFTAERFSPRNVSMSKFDALGYTCVGESVRGNWLNGSDPRICFREGRSNLELYFTDDYQVKSNTIREFLKKIIGS